MGRFLISAPHRAVIWWLALLVVLVVPVPGAAQEKLEEKPPPLPEPIQEWTYLAYLDLSYPLNFNFPENHRFRGKSTTPVTNQLVVNDVLGYVRKAVTPVSRWGLEAGLQDGKDVEQLGGDPSLDAAGTLRHLGRANLSYLFPVGDGLQVTGGLMGSYIGFESFYAKDNWNYTRTYLADNSPYFNFGLSADYLFSPTFGAKFLTITGFDYLSSINSQLSYGLQLNWKPNPHVTMVQNLYAGPDQSQTDLRFWRYFSDSYILLQRNQWAFVAAFDIGTEESAALPGAPQTFWMGSALFARWEMDQSWSLAFRPEVYWDRNGVITGSERLLRAITTTLEYKIVYPALLTTRARLEYRFDQSTGPGGGFFKAGNISPGVPRLVESQHILFFALLWSFGS